MLGAAVWDTPSGQPLSLQGLQCWTPFTLFAMKDPAAQAVHPMPSLHPGWLHLSSAQLRQVPRHSKRPTPHFAGRSAAVSL